MKINMSYALRHALSVTLAVITALLVNHYKGYGQDMWMVLAALLVGQVARGIPVRQGIIHFIIVVVTAIASLFLLQVVTNEWQAVLLVSLVYVLIGSVIFIRQPLDDKTFYFLLLFLLIFMIAMLMPYHSVAELHDRVMNAIIGCVIGIVFAQFILPIQPYQEFGKSIVPVLRALQGYSFELTNQFLHHADASKVKEQRMSLENSLLMKQGSYPEWVYDAGFNPGLRSGFRFFLVNMDRLAEILFSMNYFITNSVDAVLIHDMSQPIAAVMKKNNELIGILIDYFEYQRWDEIKADFTSDIVEVESRLNQIVPGNLEMLDVSFDYVALAAYVRDLKDMRDILLQLALSL